MSHCKHGLDIVIQILVFTSCLLLAVTSTAEESLDALRKRAADDDKNAVLELRRRLEPLANKGDTKAMIELAEWYHYRIPTSWVTESDKQKAFELYLQAAAKGSVMGMYRVGYCYHYGVVSKNKELGFKWYRKAADHGSFEAYKALAHEAGYQERKRGTNRSGLFAEIRVWREAAAKGITAACLELGEIYERSVEDYDEAENWYLKCIEMGGRAEINIAYMYDNKRKDPQGAVKWYKLTFERDDRLVKKWRALIGITWLYKCGKGGLVRDSEEAFKWHKTTMEFREQNRSRLGLEANVGYELYAEFAEFYFNGWHVPMDWAKGVKLLKAGAELGDGDSCHKLACYYTMGLNGPINGDLNKTVQIVEANQDEALRWRRKGAEYGNYDCIHELCSTLLWHKKYAEAREWLEKGAEEKGEHEGFFKYYLSLCYVKGDGCTKDVAKARRLLKESAQKGFDKAIDMCKKINLSY